MNWQEIGKKLLSVGAPILGTALMGPPGGMAVKTALSLLGDMFAFGDKSADITPKQINEAIDQYPDQIQGIELENRAELQKLINQDLASARSREVEIVKITGKRDTNLYIMSYMVIAGFFGTFGAVIFLTLPLAQEKIIFLLLGGLIAAFERVLQYFFGSSRGSQHKTDLLGKK